MDSVLGCVERCIIDKMLAQCDGVSHVNGMLNAITLLVMSISLPRLGLCAVVPSLSICINGTLICVRCFFEDSAAAQVPVLKVCLDIARKVLRITVLVLLVILCLVNLRTGSVLSVLLLLPVIMDLYIRKFYWSPYANDINTAFMDFPVKLMVRSFLVLLFVAVTKLCFLSCF